MEPTPTPQPSKSRRRNLLAANDQQLAAQALAASQYWTANPWLTLRYTTATAFAKLAAAYDEAIGTRQQTGSARPAAADDLLDLDAKIEASLYRLKARLVDKYDKKKALAHYPTLGIVKDGAAFLLPRERTKRAAALQTLLKGLKSEKIGDGDHGTAFWQPIAAQYADLVEHLTDTDGDVSKAVAAKDTLRQQIEQVLSSLAKVLDANYPADKEYKAELRAAGFQREKYR